MTKYIIVAMLASCTPVMAQPICGASVDVWEGLRGYGEERQSLGLTDDGAALAETWGNEDSGTWTIIMTSPQGVSCIIAHGGGFSVERVVEGDPA